MKKKEFETLEKNLLANTIDSKDKMSKLLIKESTIYFLIVFILMIISLFILDTVSVLSIISPKSFFILGIILCIYLGVTFILSAVFKIKFSGAFWLTYYKIHDMLSFLLLLLISLSFVVMFIVTPTKVIGNSMNDTLDSGDKILVWHLGYEPKRDDVVVIDVVDDVLYIKRIVAVEGDNVEYKDSKFYVNDVLIEDDISISQFQKACGIEVGSDITQAVIPKGHSVCFGDNRDESRDSRMIGLIKNDDILGKAIFRIIPFKNIGKIKKSIR